MQCLTTPPWISLHYPTAVVFHDRIWLFDESNSSQQPGRLWWSDDGTSWSQVAPPASIWGGKLTVFKDKLWLFGMGYNSKEIWQSDDGWHWRQVASTVPWWGYQSILEFNGKLWAVLADNAQSSYYDPSVYSSDDGVTWSLEVQNNKWNWLSGYGVTNYLGKLWILGGDSNLVPYQSTNYRTLDGIHWTTVSCAGCFPGRSSFGLTEYDGRLWVTGGYVGPDYTPSQRHKTNETWFSYDAQNWVRVASQAPLPEISTHAMVTFKNRLWVLGGGSDENGKTINAVWYSELPAGKPIIQPLGRQVAQAGQVFRGPIPTLAQGLGPRVWSLVSPPAGMSIDSVSGVVSWPNPVHADQDYRIPVRVTNAAGTGQTTLTLVVNLEPPPQAYTPMFAQGHQTTVTWMAAPQITGYRIVRNTVNDFTSPQASTDVSLTTLKYCPSGLSDDTTYWYRVGLIKAGGTISAWSAATSCTQDATAPTGRIMADDGPEARTRHLTARLFMPAQDPGSRPSGLTQMRFSTDQVHWTDWQAYQPSASCWLGMAGNKTVYAQIRDLAGNILGLSTLVNAVALDAIVVDDDNVSGPWQGTPAYPYNKIQAAINAASAGATIVIAPGTYRENLSFNGKNLVIRSADSMDPVIVKSTVIDGQRAGSVITLKGTEDASCRIEGLTLTNGLANYGGGINGNGARATLQYNRIIANVAYHHEYTDIPESSGSYDDTSGLGGGVAKCNGLIQGNVIAENRASIPAASKPAAQADAAKDGKPFWYLGHHVYCTFSGGALYQCSGTIQNNTIYHNYTSGSSQSSDMGGGSSWQDGVLSGCKGQIYNNIIYGNNVNTLTNCTAPVYCCIEGWTAGGTGNIRGNPRLDAEYHLQPGSPCIDAGAIVAGSCRDFQGEPRGINGSGQARGDGSNFDIGADEYYPPSQAIFVTAPQGEEQFQADRRFSRGINVQWTADPARAGTDYLVQLYRGNGRVLNFGQFTAPAGKGNITIPLPEMNGVDYRIRVSSNSDSAIYAQSPRFAIHANITAVPPGGWMDYQ